MGGFLLFLGAAVGLLWIGRIVPPLIEGTMPIGLEHYTTLVIQGLDLGIVIPTQVIAGVLLIKRKTFGYLLASVMTMQTNHAADRTYRHDYRTGLCRS